MERDATTDHVYNRTNNGKYHYAGENNNELDYENPKKKSKKWSLSGLFKRRRNKSSDTDSSSEVEDKKKGFLSRNSHRRKGSHKVVGKFDAIIIPKENVLQSNHIEKYDASPNVIKRKRNITKLPNGVSQSYQEIATQHEPIECVKGSGGSLDTASRRTEKSKIKARVKARRDRLKDESGSSEECASSRNSNCSLQRLPADKNGNGSWNRKSRAARTDRYIKRHYRDDDSQCCSSNTDLRSNQPPTPVGSPKSRWVAKVVYQQSSVSPTRYTARTHSATSSPMSSPLTKPKNFQCSSLPSKNYTLQQNKELFRLLDGLIDGVSNSVKISPPPSPSPPPPPPPPRNPHRKVVPPVDRYVNRPSSYAFDANARPKDIAAYVHDNRSIGYSNPFGTPNGEKLRIKSNSEVELRHNGKQTARQALGLDDHNSYPKNRNKRYSTDKMPRSRNPIQIAAKIRVDTNDECTNQRSTVPHVNRNLFADEIKPKPERFNSLHGHSENLLEFGYTDAEQRSLSKANEIGIPVIDETVEYEHSNLTYATNQVNNEKRRPLSVVSEKSDNEILNGSEAKPKPQPRNLEEALVELEEIYNSLKLGDEDLLDRADRRDLQAALKMNMKNNRRWMNETNDMDVDDVDGLSKYYIDCRVNRPRLPATRRSAKPDAVTDDMAYRKLYKKDDQDVKSNPNVVSQSGSFLLMSPALSPPPLVHIPTSVIQFNKEPDVVLDDVVYRNIRHSNSALLKVLDPQPPFGIPLGPVSPAPNSDYLHAVPSDRYRSTFNPSRNPDVVKDDAAYRSLRKDSKNPEFFKQHIIPAASKKRRAIRSLSANVVSLIGQHYSENGDKIDTNGNIKENDRCASFNDLPEINEKICNALRSPDRDPSSDCNDDKALDLLADEAEVLNKVIRKKLRELEAIPTNNGCFEKSIANDKDVFTKRVAVHKPITLSQFKISEGINEKNSRNPSSYDDDDDDDDDSSKVNNSDRSQLKLVRRRENIPNAKNSKRGKNDDVQRIQDSQTQRGDESPMKKCQQSFSWKGVKIVYPNQPERAILGEIKLNEPTETLVGTFENIDLKSDKTENSSSGVSSTSNTPDSSRKCHLDDVLVCDRFHHSEPGSPNTTRNIRAKELYLDENVLPSFGDASEQFSRELEGTDTVDKVDKPKKDFCSRIKITLSTPQSAGTSAVYTRNSDLFSNDVLIIFTHCIACLYEVFFAGCSLCELLLVLISSLAYFTITITRQ